MNATESKTVFTRTPVTARKPKAKPATPKLPKADAVALHNWATVGVWLTLAISAVLNGYANAQHAPMAWAGWLMGISTPMLVLILSRVAALQHRRKRKPLAMFTGSVGIGLLLLSVWHCATAVAMLTGSPIWLAVPMAVAIDAGLVSFELATVSDM